MIRLLLIAVAVILMLHGLIHLMGFVAYWPLKELPEIAYKTTFLDGRLELGSNGTRIYSVLWLVTAVGFVFAGIALVTGWKWRQSLLVAVTLLSSVITVMDWTPAFRSAIINLVILGVILLGPQIAKILPETDS